MAPAAERNHLGMDSRPRSSSPRRLGTELHCCYCTRGCIHWYSAEDNSRTPRSRSRYSRTRRCCPCTAVVAVRAARPGPAGAALRPCQGVAPYPWGAGGNPQWRAHGFYGAWRGRRNLLHRRRCKAGLQEIFAGASRLL